MKGRIEKEALIRELRAEMEKKLRQHEIEVIQYWQGHLAKLLSMKPENIGALQVHIKKVYDMMGNRIQILKRG